MILVAKTGTKPVIAKSRAKLDAFRRFAKLFCFFVEKERESLVIKIIFVFLMLFHTPFLSA
jgi:hypothetical protein